MGCDLTTGRTADSSDMEILDYVVAGLCKCLDTKKMAFKGGYVLNKIIKDDVPRNTIDVDFSIQIEDYYGRVKQVLCNIGESLKCNGIIDAYELKQDISLTCSVGIKLIRNTKDKKDLGVDVGLHNIEHGIVPINLIGNDAYRFSVERMLSDKISAIYSRKRFRRPKDLYDFYIITNCFDVDLKLLRNEVEIRGGIEWNLSPMKQEIVEEYRKAYNKLNISRVSSSDIEDATLYPFDDVISRLSSFVSCMYTKDVWVCGRKHFKNTQ